MTAPHGLDHRAPIAEPREGAQQTTTVPERGLSQRYRHHVGDAVQPQGPEARRTDGRPDIALGHPPQRPAGGELGAPGLVTWALRTKRAAWMRQASWVPREGDPVRDAL